MNQLFGINPYNPSGQEQLLKRLMQALQDTGYQSLEQALTAILGGGLSGSGFGTGFGGTGSGGSSGGSTGGNTLGTGQVGLNQGLAQPVGGSNLYGVGPSTTGAGLA